MTPMEQTSRVYGLIMRAADELAAAGVHPGCIGAGATAAALALCGTFTGPAGLAVWLRQLADDVEADAAEVLQ